MNTLVPLLAELDAWATEGRQATLWWRDDDATRPTAKLEALLEVAEVSGVAPVLAVSGASPRAAANSIESGSAWVEGRRGR